MPEIALDPGAARALAGDAVAVFSRAGRADLSTLAQVAAGRIERPTALVCVAGEYKQGKSSLVNQLVGLPVCPVDDDFATSALTLLHYAPQPTARVHVRSNGRASVEAIPVTAVPDWTSDHGNPDNVRGVERVEVGVPSAFLERGPALIDTPGTGGLAHGAARSVLAFLPYADALFFVSDASSELSASELDYLQRVRERCPTVLLCLTKIDICPEWRRIADLDRAHLARAGLEVPVVAVSSALRAGALSRRDRSLNDESGFPVLLEMLERDVLSRVKELAAKRAAVEIEAAANDITAAFGAELAVLDDPNRLAETVERLEAARERLEQLRGPAARWQVVLNDRITDLGNEATHRFRAGVRALLRDADAEFEKASNSDQWTALAATLQDRLADLVAEVFQTVDDAHVSIRAEVASLLHDDGGGAWTEPPRARDIEGYFAAAATASSADAGRTVSVGQGLERGFGVVRGAFGGVMVFGILGRLLPATAAAVLVSNPFTLGVGALFGIKHIRDERAKRVAAQRQQARTGFRAGVEQIQAEVGKAISDAVREVQRDLRDGFVARIEELQRQSTETIAQCQADLEGGASAREERRAHLATVLADLNELTDRARAIAGPKVDA